jgi:hypothetical protein
MLYPLSPSEKELLLHIYYTRLRIFLLGYIPAISYASFSCFRLGYRDKFTGNFHNWTAEMGDYLVTRNQMIVINMLFLVGPLLFLGYRVYRKHIASLKKDALNGVKQAIPYCIVRKSYFVHTHQYFISFDDPTTCTTKSTSIFISIVK